MDAIPLLRTSERSTFKRCPTAWWWGYREGLKPRKVDGGARWFGTGMHLVMAEFYVPGTVRGRDMHETWDEYCKDSYETVVTYDEDGEKTYHDALALGHDMIDGYDEAYQGDPQWEVLAPELRFKTLIPHPANKRKAIAQVVGTYDMLVRDHSDGKIKQVDHKNVASIQTNHLVIDDQKGTYVSLGTHSMREAGIIGPREKIHGLLYNFLRKGMRDTRPWSEKGYHNKPTKKHYVEALIENDIAGDRYDNTPEEREKTEKILLKKTIPDLELGAQAQGLEVLGDVSKQQPPPLLVRHWEPMTLKERNRQITRIGEEVQVMNEFRSGNLPIIKSPSQACTWCDFFDLCQVDEAGGDAERIKEMQFDIKDPYFDHRDGAINSKTSVSNDNALRKATDG